MGVGKQQHSEFKITISLNDINYHFSSTNTLDLQTKCQTLNYTSGLTSPTFDSFEFSPIPSEIILSIRSNAVGNGGIYQRIIVPILDHTYPLSNHPHNQLLPHQRNFPLKLTLGLHNSSLKQKIIPYFLNTFLLFSLSLFYTLIR